MEIKRTSLFERQLKKLAKKQFPIEMLKPCVKAIVQQDTDTLRRIKDHSLKGKWRGYRELHPTRYGSYGKIYDGLIVIYRLNNDELVLMLVATGEYEILNQ